MDELDVQSQFQSRHSFAVEVPMHLASSTEYQAISRMIAEAKRHHWNIEDESGVGGYRSPGPVRRVTFIPPKL